MSDMYIDVDTAVALIVNKVALIDDTDFKTRETGIVYNQAGMDLVWNFTTSAGVVTQTAVTPTTAGVYDWTHVGDGIYKIEIPASGGASINNDTEGYGFFSGICTGVLAWSGPIYTFRAAALNNALVDGGDELDVNVTKVSDAAQTANDNGADINTILSRVVGTLAAGTHNPQTGDSYAIVNNGTYGNAQLVRSTTPANTLDINATGEAGIDLDNTSGTLAKGTDITGFNDLSETQVNAQADLALTDYDPPTYDELLAFVQLMTRFDSAIATDRSTALSAINANQGSGAGTFDNSTDSEQAIGTLAFSADAAATANTTHLLDIKGTGFAKDTHSLPQCLTATTVDLNADQSGVTIGTTTSVTNIVTANMTQINSNAAAAVRLALSAGQIIPFTVTNAAFTPTSTEFEASDITEATADHYKSRIILWTTGSLTGQITSISVYSLSGSNGHFTVVAMTEAPGNGDTGIIL